MSATRPETSQEWPAGVARTCANGDGGKTIATIAGVAYCGPCALAAVKDRDAPEIS